MPICKKCLAKFPFSAVIDGRRRNLKSRSFCLECSPFGSHNTKNLNLHKTGSSEIEDCKCNTCGKEFVYNRRKGHTRNKCNSCQVNDRRPIKKRMAISYLGGKCVVCGYDKCQDAFDFHHLDPSVKTDSITKLYLHTEEKLKLELDKCVLLCCRCHREVHAGITKLPDNLTVK